MLNHIAIIPDGNRRYAKKMGLSIDVVYNRAMDKIYEIVEWCKELKIKTLTVWGFSTENWRRPKLEKKILFMLFEKKGKEILLDKRIDKEGIKIKIIGNTKQFSKKLQKLFRDIEEKTKKNVKLNLNILLNYGGRKEIIQAVNQILSEGKKNINENRFKKYLWLSDEPDIIIRTSGEQRLSGLLPFQSVYSELYFEPKYFPEIQKKDFLKMIKTIEKRERRFGK
ncbi:MAG TPA: di-trans,poly-cis-decaprenylcistransferase [Candidatus Aenigmarchaeota archaeon]|nr:di-trans,poly-cis-decaprenylcistransferase [Candidatus Aenigmarchaeota archaeon]